MKVLFDVEHPFSWAHGGTQMLVNKLMQFLPDFGIKVEPLKWWLEKQDGDIVQIFYLGTPTIDFAKKKGLKVVTYVFLDNYSSLSNYKIFTRRILISSFKSLFPAKAAELGWFFPAFSDANIYPSHNDLRLGEYLFSSPKEVSHVILHGVDDRYLLSENLNDGAADYLVCVASIHEHKNSVLLAKIARQLRIPILFIGKPYSNDPYFRSFLQFVDNKYVRYLGFLSEDEKIRYLKKARGFVLLSRAESGCIAALEALGMRMPVLLPKFKWATSLYKGYASFCDLGDEKTLAGQLMHFYQNPPVLNKFPVLPWKQVAFEYAQVYKSVIESKGSEVSA